MKYRHKLSLVFIILSANGVFLKDAEYGWLHIAVFMIALPFFISD